MQKIEPRVAARMQGPFGDLHAEPATTPELFVAGGTGVTLFLALLRSGSADDPSRRPADVTFAPCKRGRVRLNHVEVRQAETGRDSAKAQAPPNASALMLNSSAVACDKSRI
jgi:ferredoxin-NADP reductase